jgi:hypothetical protein
VVVAKLNQQLFGLMKNSISEFNPLEDKPVALSIVQARLVGLAHFTVVIYSRMLLSLSASTLGKFG